MAREDLVRPRHSLGVGAQVEAEVHRAHDRLRIPAFLVAPLVEHLALLLPVVGSDVGAVPAVGVAGGRAERALLAAAADPDRNAGLKWLGIVGGIRHAEVL